MAQKALSIFIPIFNEEKNIRELYAELSAVLERLGVDYEVIFIDDHSFDSSYKILKEIADSHREVKLIRFKRNYGQTAAMQAGFEYSTGEIVISMDGDLQNDPADIPHLIEKIKEGYDLICGWRRNRKDKLFSRRFPSILANKLISKITGLNLHDYGCTLKAYRNELVKSISLFGDMHRFIPAYAFWNGASITEIVVNHRKRKAGESKYNLSRTYKVLLDLLTVKFLSDYSTKPSYLFGGIGLFFFFIGSVLATIAGIEKIFMGVFIHRNPLLLLAVMFFLMGTFCILQGLLAEIVIRFYHESQNKQIFKVEEKLNF